MLVPIAVTALVTASTVFLLCQRIALRHAQEAERERVTAERALAEREALLQAIVEMTPAALLLMSSAGIVLVANGAARALFLAGVDPIGMPMVDLLAQSSVVLRRALAARGDELFVMEDEEGVPHTHHLAKRYFELSGDEVVLVVLSDLTHEVARQEVDVYKRVIRVVSHEINNSLAPISSLMHSARLLTTNAPSADRLVRVFDTVSERADHLRRFLAGYAELARLPLPKKVPVSFATFFDRLAELFPGISLGPSPEESGYFDRGQMEQVLVNLLRNAEEAGSAREDIRVEVDVTSAGTRLVVSDRGSGMSPDVMKNALVPLFSTKEKGGGLGLAICREIVEAHGGTLRLGARPGGGLEVVMRLPPPSRARVRSVSGMLHRPAEEAQR